MSNIHICSGLNDWRGVVHGRPFLKHCAIFLKMVCIPFFGWQGRKRGRSGNRGSGERFSPILYHKFVEVMISSVAVNTRSSPRHYLM